MIARILGRAAGAPRADAPPRKLASLLADRFDLALVAVAIALYVVLKDVPLGHDQSWYLVSINKLFHGARLYVDVIEINPPLNFYLLMPPVYLAQLLGTSPEHVFVAYVIVLAGVSTLWARRWMLTLSGVSRVHANIASVVALLSTTAFTAYDYGQRDVLLVVFTLPYLAASMRRLEGGRVPTGSAVAIGLWAALGICLKPFFLIFPLVTEIMLFLNRRRVPGRMRPELVAIGIAGAAYVAVVVTVFPDYLGSVVPLGQLTYFAYGTHFPYSLISTEILTFPLILGAYVAMRRRGALGPELDMLAAWTVAAAISYVVQNRGFTYHAAPLRIMMVFLGASLLCRKAMAPAVLPRVLTVIGFVLIGFRLFVMGLYDEQWLDQARAKLARYDTRDGLYTFTAHVFIGFPLANHFDGPWVSRFPCLWPVPGAERILAAPQNYTPEQVAAAKRADRYVTDAVVEDFQRQMPSVVIVDARPDKDYFDGVKFDYVANLERDPRFARLWRHYRRVDTLYGFDI
ncbi:MAG: hypothetical protein ACM3N5_09680, partial [Candidatus Eiseniibacteriota bacterium]